LHQGGCPPDKALVALAELRLPDEEARRLRQHLASCERCAVLFEAFAPEDSMSPRGSWAPPSTFDGFKILYRLGQGGMGEVYVAREQALGRNVALKFIAAGNTDRDALKRFMVEAKAIAQIQDPNVVSIFRIGDVLGRPYIAYEFVSGQSIDKLHKPVEWNTVLRIGIGIAKGLEAAHRSGVLHRDIKPANVMLGTGNEVKILDFGLAKLDERLIDEARARADAEAGGLYRMTGVAADPSADTVRAYIGTSRMRGGQSSGMWGTPLYLAPELWAGSKASRRSDIYALGLVLYELCAGGHPYAGLTYPMLRLTVETQDLPPLSTCCPEIPRPFADVIDRCVRRIPEERFRSAEELRAALEEVYEIWKPMFPGPSSAPPASDEGRIKDSFARIGQRVEGLVVRFYDRLFAQAPQLRALFPADLRAQRVKLASALRVVVQHLHAPERLDPMLEELGRKHAGYGVTQEHFDVFGEALIAVLAEMEGEAWDPVVEQAWAAVYVQAAAAMRRGLSDAPPTAPVEPSASSLERSPGTSTTGSRRIRYVTSGDLSLAYQIVGEGPVDLVLVQGWVTHLDATWDHEAPAGFLHELAASARLILFDQRGTGLSDRDGAGASPEQRMEDLRAVMDAAGSERAVLLGVGTGIAPCVHFAAAHPARTLGLITYSGAARVAAGSDAPFGMTPADLEHAEREIRSGWGSPLFIDQRAPSKVRDTAFRHWWASYLRLGATPGVAIRMLKTGARIDLRDVLPGLRARSLVLHRAGDRLLPAAAGRDLAKRIPGARYVELPGDDHLPFVGETGPLLAEIRRFVFDADATLG
jgi:serine/threonine protein kinase/pimeloyl-ACP methyl ester carboxylesterase